jgi:hypothetical protein
MRGDVDHLTWIKKQFAKKHTKACYRNVLIHTSFVETVVRKEARQRDFRRAIAVLRDNRGYDRNTVNRIDQLRDKRNTIIHELLKNKGLDENLINTTIKEMRELLEYIYRNSPFVQTYFRNEYHIDTTLF